MRYCQVNNKELVIKRKPSGTAIPAAIGSTLWLEEDGSEEVLVVNVGVGHVAEVMTDVTVAATLEPWKSHPFSSLLLLQHHPPSTLIFRVTEVELKATVKTSYNRLYPLRKDLGILKGNDSDVLEEFKQNSEHPGLQFLSVHPPR